MKKILLGSLMILMALADANAMKKGEKADALRERSRLATQNLANQNITQAPTAEQVRDNLPNGSPAQREVIELIALRNHLNDIENSPNIVELEAHLNAGRAKNAVGAVVNAGDTAALLAAIPDGTPVKGTVVVAHAAVSGVDINVKYNAISNAGHFQEIADQLTDGTVGKNTLLAAINAGTLDDLRGAFRVATNARTTIDNLIGAADPSILEGLLPAGAAKDGLNALFDAGDLNAIWAQLKIGSAAADAIRTVLESRNLNNLSAALPRGSDAKKTVDAAAKTMSYILDYNTIPDNFLEGQHNIAGDDFGANLKAFLGADVGINADDLDALVLNLANPAIVAHAAYAGGDTVAGWKAGISADLNKTIDNYLSILKTLVGKLNLGINDAYMIITQRVVYLLFSLVP